MCKYERSGGCLNPEADDFCLPCKKPCEHESPLTNGDRLRRMNDDDLAELFSGLFFSSEKEIASSKQMFLSWLKTAAK